MRGAGETQFIFKLVAIIFCYSRSGFKIVNWDVLMLNFRWQLLSQIPSAQVALITAGPLIKTVTNYKQVRMRIIFNHSYNRYILHVWNHFRKLYSRWKKMQRLFNHHHLFLVRFLRLLRSLTSKNVHPASWRRSFPVFLLSTLLSSHFTHSPMQVTFFIKSINFPPFTFHN